MKIDRDENGITWSYMFGTHKIPLPPKGDFIHSPKTKRIYTKTVVDHRLVITSYDLKGNEMDKRTYGYKFVNFFDNAGFACMLYYDFNEQRYFSARFLDSAGITGITPAPPPQ